ncbi:hypothetical protein ABS71_08070 [bacterium SCN 62-11]|nr:F0F1 ATP synthase subunit gamma [Candidatus Eremiobacteraeota bacterium]ODT71734.1 MAG: hypothetical protein ABS71_08070 [bacterium SCN 62-11]
MDALAGLRKQLGTVASLHSLVRALRLLSAVNLKMLAKVELAQQACLEQMRSAMALLLQRGAELPALGSGQLRLVLGSDHGLCGGFHQGLVAFCLEHPEPTEMGCVGLRLGQALEEKGLKAGRVLSAPSSEAGLGGLFKKLGLGLEARVDVVLWNQGRVEQVALWPPCSQEMLELAGRRWSGRCQPLVWGEPEQLAAPLFEQWLEWRCQEFCLRALISENQARLSVMQAAEKNLDSLRDGLQGRSRQLHQNVVTEELLDVVSGFEILNSAIRELVPAN